jgi:hypothetical protein
VRTPKLDSEVEVTQYLRPDGRPVPNYAEVGVEWVRRAEGMHFSAEVLTTGEVAIYGRLDDESEEQEITELAYNGPGDNSPDNALRRIIEKLEARRVQSEGNSS